MASASALWNRAEIWPMGTSAFQVGQDGLDHGGPVEAEWCVMRGAWCVIGAEGKFVGFSGCNAFEGEFQFHGGLAFETDLLAQAGERGHGIEEAPDTGGQRRIEAARQHGSEQPQLGGREGRTGASVGHREGGLAEHFVEQAQGGPARLFHRPVAAGQAKLAEMGHALAGGFRDEEELPAPNRAVQAVAGAVPGDAQDGGLEFILRHAGQDVGDVVLDAEELRVGKG